MCDIEMCMGVGCNRLIPAGRNCCPNCSMQLDDLQQQIMTNRPTDVTIYQRGVHCYLGGEITTTWCNGALALSAGSVDVSLFPAIGLRVEWPTTDRLVITYP